MIGRCCRRCRHYDLTRLPAVCWALGTPVPWKQMIEGECKGDHAPLWAQAEPGQAPGRLSQDDVT